LEERDHDSGGKDMNRLKNRETREKKEKDKGKRESGRGLVPIF